MSTTMWIIAGTIIGIEVIALIIILIALGKADGSAVVVRQQQPGGYPAAPGGYPAAPQGGYPQQPAAGYPAAPQQGSGYPPQGPSGFPPVGGDVPPGYPPQP